MSGLVRYELEMADQHVHEFTVRLRVADPAPAGQRLTLPAWIPGSYMIRDFARNITAISAHDGHGPVALGKIDKQTWQLGPCVGELVVDYRVYAFDLSVRTAYLDQTRAYFNGAAVFLRLPDRPGAPWELRIGRPHQGGSGAWRVATTLPVLDIDAHGFGLYSGRDYDRLIDCPVEIGAHERAEFGLGEVAHEVVVSDGGRFDIRRICSDLKPICNEHAAMFGELPVGRYVFLTLATGDGYGGLEHCDSTSLICKRSDLPAPGLGKPDKGYRQFLALCSHEYFHLWNVKRIRPASLMLSDLSCEAYTELLWAFEGITSYYDELALARSGVLLAEDYLDLFAATVSRVLRTPGRLRQSVAESSFDAWTKFYKQDENAPNALVSYYAKGALVAFGLDMTLREQSQGRVCLDDLMRRLWQRYGKSGTGVPERALEREVAALLDAPLNTFFERYVYGTQEMPLQAWFGMVGVGYRARAARDSEDLGGYQVDAPPTDAAPSLGARLEAQPAGVRITQVIAGGAAQAAGLAPGDLLVAIDAERVTPANTGELLKRLRGKTVEVHYFRRDRLAASMLPVLPPAEDTCDLWLLPEDQVSREVLARRAAWLRSSVMSAA